MIWAHYCNAINLRRNLTGGQCGYCGMTSGDQQFPEIQAPAEADPTGRAPHEPGAKMDAGKSPIRRGLLEQFPRACLAIADVSAYGARKYTWNGWETVPDGLNRYGDAECRHIVKNVLEGPYDLESGLLHAAHECWNNLARLELVLRQLETGAAI